MTPFLPAWLPPELGSAVLGMTPLLELQAAIPFGIAAGLRPWQAFLSGEVGNIVPFILVYAAGGWWIAWTERRRGWLHRLTEWFVQRARRKLHGEYNRVGLLALTVFVALPFPGAGVWTGSVGAFLIGIPFRIAWPYVLAGNVINGTIVTLATTGAVAAFKMFL
jgi:uncharacterized membrane protein